MSEFFKIFKNILRFFFIKYIIFKNYINHFFDYWENTEYKKFKNKIILISQLQKSGGHMLLSLLDGHPKLNIYPMELILKKNNQNWFDEKYFIFKNQSTFFLRAVNQGQTSNLVKNNVKNFVFSLIQQEKIYNQNKSSKTNLNLILYFFSFFKSWKNYHKTFNNDPIVFFIPQFFANSETSKKLYEYFEDCTLIYICRDPLTWCRSTKNYRPDKFPTLKKLLQFYINHQKALIKNHSKRNVIIVNYENLIKDTRVELEKLLKKLNLNYHNNNKTFTSNMQPVSTFSSFKYKKYDIPSNQKNIKLNLSKRELKENAELLAEAEEYYHKILSY